MSYNKLELLLKTIIIYTINSLNSTLFCSFINKTNFVIYNFKKHSTRNKGVRGLYKPSTRNKGVILESLYFDKLLCI